MVKRYVDIRIGTLNAVLIQFATTMQAIKREEQVEKVDAVSFADKTALKNILKKENMTISSLA